MSELESLIEKGSDTIGAMFAGRYGSGRRDCSTERIFRCTTKLLKKHDILLVADEVICGLEERVICGKPNI